MKEDKDRRIQDQAEIIEKLIDQIQYLERALAKANRIIEKLVQRNE